MCLFSAPKAPDPVTLPDPVPPPDIKDQLTPDSPQSATAPRPGGLSLFRNDLITIPKTAFGSGLNIPS